MRPRWLAPPRRFRLELKRHDATIVLDEPRVGAFFGKEEATSMAQHVRVTPDAKPDEAKIVSIDAFRKKYQEIGVLLG